MKDQIFYKLRELIATNNKIPPEQITMNSTFEELNMDSLDGITVLNDLENVYNITLPNDVVTKMRTVREVVDGLYDFLATPQAKEDHQSLEYQRAQIPTAPKQNNEPGQQ
jgi:acyl carrier protein